MDSKGLRALFVVLVVIGCAGASLPFASSGVAADAGGPGAALQEMPAEQERLENADEIHINVFLTENGSATFVVDYRYQLEGENDSTEEWEEVRADLESNRDAYTQAEADDWNETLAEGENATDREMNISNVSVSTDESTNPRNIGHVEFTFEWSSFAHVVMNEIEVGDALSGFTLVDDTTLQIVGPEGYVVYDHDPSPDDSSENSVFWNGDGTEFTDDQPRVVLIEEGNSAAETDNSDDGPAMPWVAVAAALALLASIGAAGWWLKHGRNEGTVARTDDTTPVTNGAPEPDDSDEPPPELLSNEEHVLRLLEQRGGRIKQQEVVSELDWTEAKTSQVVSGLREDGEIEVFRIGRENVLALPDENETEA